MITTAPPRPETGAGPGSFTDVLRAEWTKFRTVRGWVIGMVVAALVTVLLGLLAAEGSTFGCSTPSGPCHLIHPVGPGGEPVTDSFYFVHQPLASDGSITARITSLTGELPELSPGGRVRAGHGPRSGQHPGLEPWSKAGIIIKQNTRQGSAYAAMLVTGGYGVRMQSDFTGDIAGLPGAVTATSPRWLRLTRSGAAITGYDSADGRHWAKVGTVTLAGLPSTVAAGLFATSPFSSVATAQGLIGNSNTGSPTLATGVLDHVSLRGGQPGAVWAGHQLGGGPSDAYGVAGGGYHRAGGAFTVTGSGDVAPVPPGGGGSGQDLGQTLVGAFAGLIAVAVVAAMFVTAEYRRGLIRTTFTAMPARGRVLVAKGLVVGTIAFVLSLVVMAVIVPLSQHLLRANGNYVFFASMLTQVHIVIGASAVVAMAAIMVIALSAMLRRAAAAITAGIAVFLLPFILASAAGGGASQWLVRLTPAAGLSMLQALPHYSQVSYAYTLGNGYYPLTPLAGFAVLCGYTLIALAAATILLKRRDA
jgi:ABC-type transport system involved in multi-copper enzyme maturation permease subunit